MLGRSLREGARGDGGGRATERQGGRGSVPFDPCARVGAGHRRHVVGRVRTQRCRRYDVGLPRDKNAPCPGGKDIPVGAGGRAVLPVCCRRRSAPDDADVPEDGRAIRRARGDDGERGDDPIGDKGSTDAGGSCFASSGGAISGSAGGVASSDGGVGSSAGAVGSSVGSAAPQRAGSPPPRAGSPRPREVSPRQRAGSPPPQEESSRPPAAWSPSTALVKVSASGPSRLPRRRR